MTIGNKAKRELCWSLLILASVFLLYGSVFGEGGYGQLRRQREELRLLQLENARLRQIHQTYLQKIDKLKNDPSEVERIARERYNFARPGDIIVNLAETPAK